MLVTNFPEQVPADLPPRTRVFGYVPFSELLQRTRLLVYHGGIGTLAQTIKAGIPHLVVAERTRPVRQRLAHRAAEARTQHSADGVSAPAPSCLRFGALLEDGDMRSRCQTFADKVDGQASVTRACELIESLAGTHP